MKWCTAKAPCWAACPATTGSASPTCAPITGSCGGIRARSCCSWAASLAKSSEWDHEGAIAVGRGGTSEPNRHRSARLGPPTQRPAPRRTGPASSRDCLPGGPAVDRGRRRGQLRCRLCPVGQAPAAAPVAVISNFTPSVQDLPRRLAARRERGPAFSTRTALAFRRVGRLGNDPSVAMAHTDAEARGTGKQQSARPDPAAACDPLPAFGVYKATQQRNLLRGETEAMSDRVTIPELTRAHLCHGARRGTRQPSQGAHRRAGQTRRALWRQKPDRRLRALQRLEQRHPQDGLWRPSTRPTR